MSNHLKLKSKSKSQVNVVKAWTFQDTLLEFYRYVPTQSEKLPAHCHDYFLCIRGICTPKATINVAI